MNTYGDKSSQAKRRNSDVETGSTNASKGLCCIHVLHINVIGRCTCTENDSTKQILHLTSAQVHATHAASRSQCESTTRASHTVGHSIITDSTEEERSHKEL